MVPVQVLPAVVQGIQVMVPAQDQAVVMIRDMEAKNRNRIRKAERALPVRRKTAAIPDMAQAHRVPVMVHPPDQVTVAPGHPAADQVVAEPVVQALPDQAAEQDLQEHRALEPDHPGK